VEVDDSDCNVEAAFGVFASGDIIDENGVGVPASTSIEALAMKSTLNQ
jgi:hypothetical protein